jgi:hypothetical protein
LRGYINHGTQYYFGPVYINFYGSYFALVRAQPKLTKKTQENIMSFHSMTKIILSIVSISSLVTSIAVAQLVPGPSHGGGGRPPQYDPCSVPSDPNCNHSHGGGYPSNPYPTNPYPTYPTQPQYPPAQQSGIYRIQGAIVSGDTLYFQGKVVAYDVDTTSSAYSTSNGVYIFYISSGYPFYYSARENRTVSITKAVGNIVSISNVYLDQNGYVKLEVTYGSGNRGGVTTQIYLGYGNSPQYPPTQQGIYPIQGANVTNYTLYFQGSRVAFDVDSATSAYSTNNGAYIFYISRGYPHFYSARENRTALITSTVGNISYINRVFVDQNGYIKLEVTYGSGNVNGLNTQVFVGY